MNTSKMSLLAIVAIWMFSMMACQKNGETISRNYTLTPFYRVAVQSDINVNINYSAVQTVKVTGADNLLSNLDMYVLNGTLVVKMKVGFYDNNLTADITIPTFDYIEVSNDADVKLGAFAGLTDLQLKVMGSGTIKSEALVVSNKIDSYIGGSGTIELQGIAHKGDIAIGASGIYKSYGLLTSLCYTNIEGSGYAEVNVTDELNVHISGGGTVYYKGNPTIQTTITGSGTVVNAN
jgi:hypothetical protein